MRPDRRRPAPVVDPGRGRPHPRRGGRRARERPSTTSPRWPPRSPRRCTATSTRSATWPSTRPGRSASPTATSDPRRSSSTARPPASSTSTPCAARSRPWTSASSPAHLAVAVRAARRRARGRGRRRATSGRSSCASTCACSGSSDPDVLLDRVAAYRTVALARLAVRSWCQLKPQRLRPVLALLDAARSAAACREPGRGSGSRPVDRARHGVLWKSLSCQPAQLVRVPWPTRSAHDRSPPPVPADDRRSRRRRRPAAMPGAGDDHVRAGQRDRRLPDRVPHRPRRHGRGVPRGGHCAWAARSR